VSVWLLTLVRSPLRAVTAWRARASAAQHWRLYIVPLKLVHVVAITPHRAHEVSIRSDDLAGGDAP